LTDAFRAGPASRAEPASVALSQVRPGTRTPKLFGQELLSIQKRERAHSHYGNPPKNIFKKWKIFATQNHALKSPQFTINPPQTHHEFTIKKHSIFANPLQKPQQKPRISVRPKKSQKQIRRR
jgi:hypothetical protein